MKYSELSHHLKRQQKLARKHHLLPELYRIRDIFIECGVDTAKAVVWGLLNDIIYWINAGCPSKGQINKAKQIIQQFGSESLFYTNWKRGLHSRERYRRRILYVCWRIVRFFAENDSYEKRTQYMLSGFRRDALGFIHYLSLGELTFHQKKRLWAVEHFLGIYYEDLSPEENGVIVSVKPENKKYYSK